MNTKQQRYLPCRTCAKQDGPYPGYVYTDDRKAVVECECHVKWRQTQLLRRKQVSANVWVDFKHDLDKDYKGTKSLQSLEHLREYANNFDSYKHNLVYLYGPNGTQKTTLSMAVGSMLLSKGYSVFYVLMESLVASLLPDFTESNTDKKLYIEKALTADLLIVDEAFDRAKVTLYKSGYQIPFLDRFFRERFDVDRKGILFVSNHAPSTIAESGFGASLQSLVERNTKGSTLTFEDKYIMNANQIDTGSIFKRK